jgi:hypothetical protein
MNDSTREISPLRQRLLEDMRLRKLAPKTQIAYIRSVRRLAGYLRRPPDTATVEDLRNFQLHLVDQGTSPITLNATITGLKFSSLSRWIALSACPNEPLGGACSAPESHGVAHASPGAFHNLPERRRIAGCIEIAHSGLVSFAQGLSQIAHQVILCFLAKRPILLNVNFPEARPAARRAQPI